MLRNHLQRRITGGGEAVKAGLLGMKLQTKAMPKTITVQMPATGDISQLKLPAGVQSRLQELLDRQDKGIKLTAKERKEAEGLVDMAEWLSLLKMRTQRLAQA